jgi:hypothetical protein
MGLLGVPLKPVFRNAALAHRVGAVFYDFDI